MKITCYDKYLRDYNNEFIIDDEKPLIPDLIEKENELKAERKT